MRHVALWLAVVALVLAYPLATLATGGPSFPTRDECIVPATKDGNIDAVFGYFDTEAEASKVRDSALAAGFVGAEIAGNGCGRIRVAVGGIPTLVVGRDFVEEAHGVGFDVTLEQVG